ncbi:MAG: DUF1800 domain-containing protein [Cytophagaceae bacterium]|nr:DUF1800 domain-containing protein [Cytophagaceae bacterium]MBK9933877.1 DUF1800 domain-containing protein [Cytophagaceae bacterium]MBL0302406.1 DUF1800 domain-containing protein [Cytophagaceae bacterium]MBL0325232.1 DUF1800 domain-containing protein [Cytophagaceae bacterium]
MKSFGPISHEKFTGTFDAKARKHLLSRTLFGVSLKDVQKFEKYNLDQAVNELVKVAATPNPPVNHYESSVKDTTGVALGQTWVNALYGDGTVNSRRQQSLKAWWILQMHFQTTSIHEKMCLFWHNHFATEISSYDDARMGYKYLNTIRKFALGNFKDFVKAISLDPAMLVYLNGYHNTKTAPDENYARELQELFTLGKGPNSKYTEDDVKNAAKVLTGYRVNRDTVTSYFQADRHDTTDKKFSTFFGNKTITGRTGDSAQNELDDLLTMIFSVEEVSLFIVRKLYIFFFYYEITAEIEEKFIVPIAKIFRDNKYEIAPVLKAMFSSKHFYDSELRGAVIKSPVDHILGVLRVYEPTWPVYENYILEYYLLANDLGGVADKGEQVLGNPPSVAGWPAYYQSPVFHEIWINSTTLPQRTKASDNFIAKGLKRNNQTLSFDPIAFISKLKNPSDPNALIEELTTLFFQIDFSAKTKSDFKTDFLLDNQASDYYWTEIWTAAKEKPTNTNISLVNTRLRKLLTYLMDLPEYQLH